MTAAAEVLFACAWIVEFTLVVILAKAETVADEEADADTRILRSSTRHSSRGRPWEGKTEDAGMAGGLFLLIFKKFQLESFSEVDSLSPW